MSPFAPARSCTSFTCHAERHPPACCLGHPAVSRELRFFAAASMMEPVDTACRAVARMPSSLVPALIEGLNDVISISSGDYHACALLSDKTVRCWGANEAGQLGNGNTKDSTTPVVVVDLSNPTVIAAGETHTCARLDNGSVRCWGDNWIGQLGNGEMGHTAQPVTVLTASSTFLPLARRP